MNQVERDDLLSRLDERTDSICVSLDGLKTWVNDEEKARIACRAAMDERVRFLEQNGVETKTKIKIAITVLVLAAAGIGAFIGEWIHSLFTGGK